MRFLGSSLKKRKKPLLEPAIGLNRPLSLEERAILEFVLANTSAEAERFLDQLDRTTVVGVCRCGCPTVSLAGPESLNELWSGPNPLVDLLGRTQDDRLVGLLVFATRRQLSGLEVYNLSESEEPWSWPTIVSLQDRDGTRLIPRQHNA